MINLQSWLPCVLLSLFEIKLFPPFFILETIAHLTHNGHPCVSTNCFQCVPLQILQHSHHTCFSIIISGDKARPLFAERTERLKCVAARASLDLFLFVVAWSAVLASSKIADAILSSSWFSGEFRYPSRWRACCVVGLSTREAMTGTFFLGLLGRFALVVSTARFREVLLGNAPRTALGETGTFVDAFFFVFCLLSRSLFCFIKPPFWFGCFSFTLLFYNNARPLLSSFLFSIFKYYIFVLHVKPCIIFSFLLFLPLAWFTQSLSSSFSHVSIDKCLKAILSRPFIYMPTVHRCSAPVHCTGIRTFFSRYSRNDLVSGLLWFKEQF